MNEHFKPGHTLMTIKPYAHCLETKFKGKLCDFCFSTNLLNRCSNCKFMHYCNATCQRSDWQKHKLECDSFKNADLKLLNNDQIRLFLRLLIDNKNKETSDEKGLKTFSSLMDHVERIKNDSNRLAQMHKCLRTIKHLKGEDFLNEFKPGELLSIFGKMIINSLNISNEELTETLGTGLYLSASSLNHSCEPNCVLIFDGIQLKVKAIDCFNSMSEASISYINLISTCEERQQILNEQYYFKCSCRRCLNEKGNEKALPIYCKECKNDLIDVQDTNVSDNLAITCENCQKESEIQINCIQEVKQCLSDKIHANNAGQILSLIEKFNTKCNLPSECVKSANLVKINELLMDQYIEEQKFDQACNIGVGLIQSYKQYLPKNHPFTGLHFFKQAKLQHYLGNHEDALKNFAQAEEILKVTYDHTSSLYKNLREQYIQFQAERSHHCGRH